MILPPLDVRALPKHDAIDRRCGLSVVPGCEHGTSSKTNLFTHKAMKLTPYVSHHVAHTPLVGFANFKTSEGETLGKDLGDLGDNAMLQSPTTCTDRQPFRGCQRLSSRALFLYLSALRAWQRGSARRKPMAKIHNLPNLDPQPVSHDEASEASLDAPTPPPTYACILRHPS